MLMQNNFHMKKKQIHVFNLSPDEVKMLCTASSVENFISYIRHKTIKKQDANKIVANVVAKLVFDTCVSACKTEAGKQEPIMEYDYKIGKWTKRMEVYPPMSSKQAV